MNSRMSSSPSDWPDRLMEKSGAGRVDGVPVRAEARDRVADHPAVDLRHHLVAFGRREERTRRYVRAVAVAHAQQNLETRPVLHLLERRDWLRQEFEFIAIQRLLDVRNELHVVVSPYEALVLEVVDLDAVAPVILRRFAGHSRGGQRARPVALTGSEGSDAHADGDLQGLSPSR